MKLLFPALFSTGIFLSIAVDTVAEEWNSIVFEAQETLQRLGYDPGQVNGKWGRKTASSIRKFQKDNGMAVTAELDHDTVKALLVDQQQPDKQPTISQESTKEPAVSIMKTTYETSKDNGNFFSAQEITEGVIIGRRGSERDRADYYKVKAKGSRMTLDLDLSLEKKSPRSIMTVYDMDKKLVGEDSGKGTPPLRLTVTPQASYFIKLDLITAPAGTSQYRLYVQFQ